MKLTTLALLSTFTFGFICSCKQNEKSTFNYSQLNFDTTRIAIFKWDTTKYSPNNSDPLPLTQDDLRVTDSLLNDAIDSFNINISPVLYRSFDHVASIDSFIIKPKNYRYQFFPYRDVNGQRIISIIAFISKYEKWKTEMYIGKLHYGLRKMTLQINLSEKTRDNLYTSDYG